jgi:hypothetical protein
MSSLPNNKHFVVMINAKNSYEQRVLFDDMESEKQESAHDRSPQQQAWAHIQRHSDGIKSAGYVFRNFT